MSQQSVKEKAAEAGVIVEEVTAVALPEPAQEVVPYTQAEPPVAAEIEKWVS